MRLSQLGKCMNLEVQKNLDLSKNLELTTMGLKERKKLDHCMMLPKILDMSEDNRRSLELSENWEMG